MLFECAARLLQYEPRGYCKTNQLCCAMSPVCAVSVLLCRLCCAQLNNAAAEVTRLHGLPVIDLGGMVFGLEPKQYLDDQHHPNKVSVVCGKVCESWGKKCERNMKVVCGPDDTTTSFQPQMTKYSASATVLLPLCLCCNCQPPHPNQPTVGAAGVCQHRPQPAAAAAQAPCSGTTKRQAAATTTACHHRQWSHWQANC